MVRGPLSSRACAAVDRQPRRRDAHPAGTAAPERPISITARGAAQRPVEVPFLDGTIDLATGAPDLAHATGAALLPVFTTRAGTDRFEVAIEEPIAIDASQPRRESSRAAVAAYARRLEPYVRRWPEQWLGWLDL